MSRFPAKRELPTNCYRIDPSGRIDLVVSEDQVPDPNGIAFSPDYKKLYVISTGKGPGDSGPGGKGNMYLAGHGWDVVRIGDGQRILATAITQHMTVTFSGAY